MGFELKGVAPIYRERVGNYSKPSLPVGRGFENGTKWSCEISVHFAYKIPPHIYLRDFCVLNIIE